MQETRYRYNTHQSTNGWLFIGGAAEEGSYGTKTWIDTPAMIGKQGEKKVCMSRSAITILLRHARLVILVAHREAVTVIIVKDHTPHEEPDVW